MTKIGTKQAAEILGIHPSTIGYRVKTGKLKPLNPKKGKTAAYKFDEAEVRLLAGQHIGVKPNGSMQERVEAKLSLPPLPPLPRKKNLAESRLERIENKLDELLRILR